MNDNKVVVITPSVLLIIIILFLSGLLLRFLWRPQPTHPNDVVLDNTHNLTALQGQLQQLFHLHDSGVDQSFIDTLPVFPYNSIRGLKFKTPFDCAICLSEFEPLNNLRLLPNCSHAFHLHCIDTWLLSHSTCPLCRSSLLHNHSNNTLFPPSPILQSPTHSSTDILPQQQQQSGSPRLDAAEVITVKLGNFRNVGEDGSASSSSSSNNKIDARRCFSMGSFAYVMDQNSSLRLPITAQIITNNSIQTTRRAVSFRFPLHSRNDDGHDHFRAKNEKFDTTSTISDSDFRYHDENNTLEARAPSFARRTLLWLTGKHNKVLHSSSPSSDNV